MAAYTVTRACGHEERHQLFGPHKQRESRLAWLRRTLCHACYRVERDAEGPEPHLRPTSTGVELVLLNSYSVREVLSSRGYRFGHHSLLRPIRRIEQLMDEGAPGWSRTFGADEADALCAELTWIREQGWARPQVHDFAHSIMAALVDGRPDLLR